MQLRPLTFADIMEQDLYYYDLAKQDEPGYQELFLEFCTKLGITYLPALSPTPSYFQLVDGVFEGPLSLMKEQYVDAFDPIFTQSALRKFGSNEHNVLFVMNSRRIVGVVHICDYNKHQVFLYYYAYLLNFEKKLRDLLILNGYTNEDMVKFYESSIKKFKPPLQDHYKARLRDIQKDKQTRWVETLGDFQAFPIADLLWLASYKRLLDIDRAEIDELRELRNTIMHGQDTVSTDGLLFSFESLSNHFRRISLFLTKYSNLLTALDQVTHKDRSHKNDAKWKALQQFSQPIFQQSRLMWHYLEE
ncbi:MAG: hypothetical protein NWR72_21890 [Bacteroidia bacterium]|nr:hypothetical protein [Bacteroidia bacterium]